MKAANLYKPKDIKYEEVNLPEIGERDVLVEVKACGICGSDIPRVMETGTYHFPTIPGHEFSGVISKIGKDIKDISVGTRVTVNPCIPCRKCVYCKSRNYFQCENYDYLGSRSNGGFAEYVKVPADNVVKLPDTVDFEEGSFIEPLAVALHILNRGLSLFFCKRAPTGAGTHEVGAGTVPLKIAIFGMGPIGNLIAQVASANGAGKIFCVDVIGEKLKIAEEVGLKETINAKETDPVKKVLDSTENLGVDIAVEAAGSEIALMQCIKVVKKSGKVIIVGRSEKNINLPWEVFSLILRKEITIYGSYGFDFNEPPDYPWDECISLISSGKVKIKPLITHRFKLSEAPEVFKMLYERKVFFNKVLLIPEKGDGSIFCSRRF